MSYPTIRDNADFRALERRPLEEMVPAHNAFEAVRLAAQRYANNIALKLLQPGDPLSTPTEISYREFLARSTQTANLFHDLGLRPGAAVSFLLPLCAEAYYTIIGGEAAGIVNAVNPLLEDWQIARILEAADSRILVTSAPEHNEEIWKKVQQVCARLPNLETIITVGGANPNDGTIAMEDRLGDYPSEQLASGREIAPDDIAAYFHTGGTTGTPKLAPHTHRMQASQVWSTGVGLGFGPEDVLTVGLPLFHIGGSIVFGLVPLAHAATLLVLSPAGYRDPNAVQHMWRIVERYRVTMLGAVPTVLGALLNFPVGDADLSSIRFAGTGGAPLPTEVGRALSQLIGKPVLEGYGMTETTSFVTLQPRDGENVHGSAGLVLPHCEVRTVEFDADGQVARDCSVDEIGHVVMRGACVTPGYVQDQYNAGVLLLDGWLNSGDLGRFDSAGRLWITGRAKDLIIRGGHNIDPLVIEETLSQHEAVELAAAVGKPDAYAGELPVAYVQLKPGAAATAEELKDFTRAHIPERAATPVNLYLMEVMPLTAVGKIFKPALRWDAAEREFSALLKPLVEECGREIKVAVGAHDRYGSMAKVTVSGSEDGSLATRIHELLGAFTLPHEIAWS